MFQLTGSECKNKNIPWHQQIIGPLKLNLVFIVSQISSSSTEPQIPENRVDASVNLFEQSSVWFHYKHCMHVSGRWGGLQGQSTGGAADHTGRVP